MPFGETFTIHIPRVERERYERKLLRKAEVLGALVYNVHRVAQDLARDGDKDNSARLFRAIEKTRKGKER